jgi:16S rRNA (adenine1518-N6/adenine1519-N6)-dimethyltransferase
MRQLLATRGIQLTRSWARISCTTATSFDASFPWPDCSRDRVLEIGPGLGPLTEHLLSGGASVLAVEKDARLAEALRERLGRSGADRPDSTAPLRLDLVQGDALTWLKREPRDWRGWKMVSNLPYSVASPILVTLATRTRSDMVASPARVRTPPGGRARQKRGSSVSW